LSVKIEIKSQGNDKIDEGHAESKRTKEILLFLVDENKNNGAC